MTNDDMTLRGMPGQSSGMQQLDSMAGLREANDDGAPQSQTQLQSQSQTQQQTQQPVCSQQEFVSYSYHSYLNIAHFQQASCIRDAKLQLIFRKRIKSSE